MASSLEIASQVGLRGGNRRRQWCVRKVYDAEKLMQTLREEREAAEAVARANRQFQSKMLECQVRTEPLGMDRDFNTFWRFAFDERKIRIFVHNVKNKTWQYYSRAKEIKLLHDSLDRRGVRERALRENLKDYLDSLKDDIEDEEEEEKMDVVEDEKESTPIEWKSEGPFVGRHVRRVFDDEPSDAVVTGYVPEDGEDCALWHVRGVRVRSARILIYIPRTLRVSLTSSKIFESKEQQHSNTNRSNTGTTSIASKLNETITKKLNET